MLLIVTTALGYSPGSPGQPAKPPKAFDMGDVLVAGLAVAAAAVIAAVVVMRMVTNRSLVSRQSFLAMPTESFDPTSEEVLRLASQLSRTRRAVHRFVPRRSQALRIRLVALPGGRVVQFVEGPQAAASVLRMGAYAEVELLPPETVQTATLPAVALPSAGGDESHGAEQSDPDL